MPLTLSIAVDKSKMINLFRNEFQSTVILVPKRNSIHVYGSKCRPKTKP